MATLPDLLYVAWFAAVGLLIDYLLFWPIYKRRSQTNPARARRWLWGSASVVSWLVVVVGAALWLANDRSWTSLGFVVPHGWRLWTAISLFLLLAAYNTWGVVTLARSADERVKVRQQFKTFSELMPHTRTELSLFAVASLTAGFCEEFLFRGYFIWVFSHWLGWWGAAALSVPIFGIGHLYQGWNGVLRTGIFGALYTLVVALCNSLWPAIALHVLTDLGGGTMAWVALREGSVTGNVEMVDQPTEPQSASGVN